ncbi:HAD-IA family hydrolase [Candidatus Saccharibacteria bacterium]|jgi:FMN phosphatase YigB (HAD superfamily)|nr:HAD-IA family hydrolase [Candidatus Saccharibacteria bacterium]
MIKALIFDCFGVFYTDPVFDYMNDPMTSLEKAKALHALDEQAALGALSKDEFVARAASLIGDDESEVEQRFFHSSERNGQLLMYLHDLRQQYKVVMLSNIGGDMMDGFFPPEERQQLFDVVILSGNAKIAKPDRAIFELACRRLGVELSEAVMIDDMPATCEIVKTFGMQSVCYKDYEQFRLELATILE